MHVHSKRAGKGRMVSVEVKELVVAILTFCASHVFIHVNSYF